MSTSSVVAGLLRELELPPTVLSLLEAHARAVLADADRLGLVAERGLNEILLRHTADSLLFALALRPTAGQLWLDAGSGAGFPGLVLAAAFPGTEFQLVEPQSRRAGFLDLQILTLGLGNASVVSQRVERLPASAADVVVARALERPQETIPGLSRLLRPGGCVLIAAGPESTPPVGAIVMKVGRAGVDSPGRLFMMTQADAD